MTPLSYSAFQMMTHPTVSNTDSLFNLRPYPLTPWERMWMRVRPVIMTTALNACLQLWKHPGLTEFSHSENWVTLGKTTSGLSEKIN